MSTKPSNWDQRAVDDHVGHAPLFCKRHGVNLQVIASGDNEANSPGGAAACSEIETPRLIGGIGLALLGITGLGVAGLLPSSRDGERRRGAGDIPALDHPVLGEDPKDKP